MKSFVHTYYAPVRGLDAREQATLIDLWKRNWSALGWTPRVLTFSDAQMHPRYTEFSKQVNKFPSINTSGYDRHCWLRWLAFARAGGGLMTDYDVLGIAASPTDFPDDLVALYDKAKVPCLVSAERPESIIDEILLGNFKIEPFHFSDMLFFQQSGFPVVKPGLVLDYAEKDWLKARAVHLSHHGVRMKHPRDRRIDIIQQVASRLPGGTK